MPKQNNDFTIEQDEYIEKYYLIKSDTEIGLEIGKKKSQVQLRRMKLGFKKQRQTFNKEAPEGMKWCWYCNEFHHKEEFTKNKSKPDGLQDECRMAVKLINLKRKANKNKNNKVLKEKFCEICGNVKSIENFIKNVSTKDGYSNLCKECLNKNNETNRFKIMEDK